MASKGKYTQEYPSSNFVESCGAILFNLADLTNKTVCICQIAKSKEWVLPKGRRNIGESRKEAALREVYEETGFRGTLLPVTMQTRACAPDAPSNVRDVPCTHKGIIEPIMYHMRQTGVDNGIKIIWWYIAVLDRSASMGPGEDLFSCKEFMACEEAIARLSFESDKNVLHEAVRIIEASLAEDTSSRQG